MCVFDLRILGVQAGENVKLPLLGFWQLDDDQDQQAEAEIQDEVQQSVSQGKRAQVYSALPRGVTFNFVGADKIPAILEIVDGGVLIKQGSQATLTVKDHFELYGASYAARRRELIESGILLAEESCLRFTQDQFFTSASAAASVIAGQNQNADHWVASDGTNLGDLLRKSRAK